MNARQLEKPGIPKQCANAAIGVIQQLVSQKTTITLRGTLKKRGIRVLSAGSDEVPGVDKNIEQVLAEQADLVEPVAHFDPKIVKMCGDGSRAED